MTSIGHTLDVSSGVYYAATLITSIDNAKKKEIDAKAEYEKAKQQTKVTSTVITINIK